MHNLVQTSATFFWFVEQNVVLCSMTFCVVIFCDGLEWNE